MSSKHSKNQGLCGRLTTHPTSSGLELLDQTTLASEPERGSNGTVRRLRLGVCSCWCFWGQRNSWGEVVASRLIGKRLANQAVCFGAVVSATVVMVCPEHRLVCSIVCGL